MTSSPDSSTHSLHTLWAQDRLPAQFSPDFEVLLQALKSRFRIATVMVVMARDGATVFNMRAGTDPTVLDCKAALAVCRKQANGMYVIEDAAESDAEALVSRSVRFYAGVPLVISPDGPPTGMLCLIHTKPRGFSRADRMLLRALAHVVSALLLMPHDPAAALVIALSAEKSVLLLDGTQMVEAANTRFTELTGFVAGDLLKTGIDDLLCLDRPSSGALVISHAMLAETPGQGLTRCHTKAGGTVPIEVFVCQLRNQRGRVIKTLLLLAPLFSGPLEDYLLSLRSTERHELLALHIAGLWAVDNAGLICKLSGAPVAHLDSAILETTTGKRLDCAGVFDPAQPAWAAFYQSIAQRSLPDEVECCVTHNGHSQWYSMLGFRQYDARGQAIGYHGSFHNVTRRKLKEFALLKAQERQALILKGTNDGAWDWDLETGEYYLSPRWWQMLGHDADSFPPTPELWLQFVHPDDRLAVSDNFNAAIAQGRDSYQSEFRMQHQRGHYFPVLMRGHILRNAQGTVVRTSGTNQDLTAQRQAQAQIRLLQTCVESLRDSVLITHASPRKSPGPIIAYVNPAFENATGYSSDEVIGNSPRLLQGPQTCRQTLAKISAAIDRWQGIRCELANYKKNGELFWVEIDIIPVKAEGSERFTHWIGVQRDITQRKHSEQVLRTTTERLNMAVEASDLGLWTMHRGRNEVFRDNRSNMMLGHAPLDTNTTVDDWNRLVHPDDLGNVMSQETQHLYTEETFEKEFRVRHADGRWVWLQTRGRVIERDATGMPLVLAGTHIDVTARVESRLLSIKMHAQLSRCLEHLNVGVMLQRDGTIQFVNSTLIDMFGAAPGDNIVGSKFSSYILPGDIPVAAWRQQQLMAGATLASHWFNCLHRDGRVFKALTSSTVIEWEGERHILSTITPPGDAALLQEGIEKTRAQYEVLLANQLEKEQLTIAHELHDSLGSQLASISLQAAGIRGLGEAGKPLDAAIDELLGHIKTAAEMTRNLARGLAPVDDWPGALEHALEKLCRDFSSTKGLQCEFEIEGDFDAVTGQAANHLYRIAQESIANALRHGAAQRIKVGLIRSDDDMMLTIFDDGRGFEVRSVLNETRKGLGLSSMYARADAIGAQITLEQIVPRGFCVSVNWKQC